MTRHIGVRPRVPAGSVPSTRLGGVLVLDEHGYIRFCDRDLALLFGCEAVDMVNRSVREFLPELGTGPMNSPDVANLAASSPRKYSIVPAWGRQQKIDVWCHELGGQAHGMKVLEARYSSPASVGEDWTNLLRGAYHSPDAVMVTDPDGLIEYVNPRFEAVSGYKAVQILGRRSAMEERLNGEEAGSASLLGRLMMGETLRRVMVRCQVEGETLFMEADVRPYVNAAGVISHLVHTVGDESRSKGQLEALAYAATHDPLTELPNRRLFLDRFEQALRGGSHHGVACTLAFLDVDNLKPVNDNHGHGVGDMLLKAVATQLRHCIREVDTVARLGGDEFGLILVDTTNQAAAATVFDKILACMQEPLVGDGARVRSSLSIGACFCPAQGGGPHAYLSQADEAMYSAKRAGGNRYHFFNQVVPWPTRPVSSATEEIPRRAGS